MRVPYTRMPDGNSVQWMPYLQVALVGPAGRSQLPMLVDSGSMESLVPDRYLQRLGVPIDGEEVTLMGAGGREFTGRAAELRIEFRQHSFVSRVLAFPGDVRSPPILGHRDFFLNFWVAFDTSGHGFHVSPARDRGAPGRAPH